MYARFCRVLVLNAVGLPGVLALFGAALAQGQSPFFCTDYDNHGFDCVEHGNIFDPNSIACPDPLEEPWCACLKTYFSTTAPGGSPSITQEILYREDQPTAGTYFVEVSGGTLDLSTVSPGDVVFNFIVCVDGSIINQIGAGCEPDCPPFFLDFEAVATEKTADTVDVDLTLPPETDDNPINLAVLNYNPVDQEHSFGKTYVGKLQSRGAGKGFTFEYSLYEPDPNAGELSRGLQDGDLDGPGFTVEALLKVTDSDAGLYTSPLCGTVSVSTIITPKVPVFGPPEVTEKTFESEIDLGGADFTVGITGSTSATVGGTVTLTATTNAASAPAFAWAVTSGTANLVDNGDGTASVASNVEGSVTVRLTGMACNASKTVETTITFSTLAGGRQKPGDCNQDGGLDLSDAVCVLEFLFLGTRPALPCGDGFVGHAANLSLMDHQPDGGIDLSDVVGILTYLFLGGSAPALGVDCVRIIDCPDNDNCP